MAGTVTALYICSSAAAVMEAVNEARLVLHEGIAGDRYALGTGTFSKKGVHKADQEVTLIEAEEIDRFSDSEGLALDLGAARRNIVTRGIRLNDLVGVRFRVGETLLEGVRLCEPCAHLGELVSPKVVAGLLHRAGLRARILTGGRVKPGDAVVPQAAG